MAVIVRALWTGFLAFVPTVVVATAAVSVMPHVRSIDFVPLLRYVVLVPACGIAAVVSALLYAYCDARTEHPQWILGAALLGMPILLTALATGFAGQRALRPALLSTVAVAMTLAVLVPRLAAQPPRAVVSVLMVLAGVVELVAALSARVSERLPTGEQGDSFDIPARLFDVNHRYIDLSGIRVHYVDEGTGPTLLFLHGNPSWSFQWRELIAGLRSSFRCVALDYPGFGMSSAPPNSDKMPSAQSQIVEELVDRLGLRDVTLVMHDWGGPIGLGLAGRRPELVRAVVLADTWAWPTTTKEIRGKFSVIAGGAIGEFVQMNFNAFVPFAIKEGTVRPLSPEVLEMYSRPFVPLRRRGVATFYPAQITAATEYLAQVEAGLGRIREKNALILWGLRDKGFSRTDLQRFQKAFPRNKTIELPDGRHFFFEDSPDLVVRAIADFAAEHNRGKN